LEALKTQHETLVKSLHALSNIDTGPPPSARASPLPSTAEEEEGDYQFNGRFGTPSMRKSTRTSIATTFSDGTTSREWFDALDGGEEFFLEPEPTPIEEKVQLEVELFEGSRSSLGDAEEQEDIYAAQKQDKGEVVVDMDPVEKAQHVARRTELPSGPIGDEGSLFTVLKKNVGKVRNLL
jgi:oxysterol-binding protein-related protein 3/6/7